MLYKVQGPDGFIHEIEGPEGASDDQIIGVLQQYLRDTPPPQPKGGFIASLKSGTADQLSGLALLDQELGLRSSDDVERQRQHLEAYKNRTYKPEAPESWTDVQTPAQAWAKLKETVGGSLPAMVAPLAGGVIGGPIGAGVVSGAQFTGQNLQRQQQEGQPLDVSNAALAAIPQAALDVIGFKFIPGIRQIFAKAGVPLSEGMAKKALTDYAVATGKAATVEGVTESAQQLLERAQAGLSLDDEDARKEYLESFIGGAVLGGTIAPAGRYFERGQLRRDEERKRHEQNAQEALAARQQREQEEQQKKARENSPEFLLDLDKRWQDASAQAKGLQDQIKELKGDLYADQRDELKTQLAEYTKSDEFTQLRDDHKRLRSAIAKAKITPEDAMLNTVMQGEGMKPAGPSSVRRKFTQEPEQAQTDPVQDYITEQVEAARQFGAVDPKDQIEWLMRDPQMARQISAQRHAIPGIPQGQSRAMLGAIGLRMKQADKAATVASQQEMKQRGEDLTAAANPQVAPGPDVSQFMDSTAQVEEHARNAPTNLDYLDPLFEKALAGAPEPTVKVPDSIKPMGDASVPREQLLGLYDRLEQLRQDADYAQKAGERQAAVQKLTELAQVKQQIEQVSSEPQGGADTAHLKTGPGPGPEPATYRREIVRLRDEQQNAVAEMQGALDDIRHGFYLGGEQGNRQHVTNADGEQVSAGFRDVTRPMLEKRAEEAKRRFVAAALQEAATHRKAAGQPFTRNEAIQHGLTLAARFDDFIGGNLKDIDAKRKTAQEGEVSDKEPTFERTAQYKGNRSGFTPEEAAEAQNELQELRRSKFGTLEPRIAELEKLGRSDDAARVRAHLAFVDERIGKLTERLQRHVTENGEARAPRDVKPNLRETFQSKLTKDLRGMMTPPQPQARRVDTGFLKPTFPRAEEAEADYRKGDPKFVLTKIDKALERQDADPRAVAALEKARDAMQAGEVPQRVVDAAESLADRVALGQENSGQAFGQNKVGMTAGRPVAEVKVDAARDTATTTRIGARGRKPIYEDVRGEISPSATIPEIAEIEDALRLQRESQPNAGPDGKDNFQDIAQRSLPGIEDTVFSRMTPEDFRRTPQVKAARDAVDAAIKLRKKTEEWWADRTKKADEAVTRLRKAFDASVDEYNAARENLITQTLQAMRDWHFGDKINSAKARLTQAEEAMRRVEQRQGMVQEDGDAMTPARHAINQRVHEARQVVDQAQAELDGILRAAESQITEKNAKALATFDEALAARRANLRELETKLHRAERDRAQVAELTPKVAQTKRSVETAESKHERHVQIIKKAEENFKAALRRAQQGMGLPGRRHTVEVSKGVTEKNGEYVETETRKTNVTPITSAEEQAQNARLEEARAQGVEAAQAAMRAERGEKSPRVGPRASGPVQRHVKGSKSVSQPHQAKPTEVQLRDVEATAQNLKGAPGTSLRNAEGATALSTRLAAAEAEFEQRRREQKSAATVAGAKRLFELKKQIKDMKEEVALLERDKQAAADRERKQARKEKVAANKVKKQQKAAGYTGISDKRVERLNRVERALEENAETIDAEADDFASEASKLKDDDVLFRTGTGGGMKQDAVQKASDAVTSKWAAAPDVVVVQSEAALPFSIPDGKRGKVPGVFHGGKVYLVADNLSNDADVGLTLAHEVAGHYGLRGLLGSQFAPTMDSVYEGNAKVREQADAKMKAEGLDRQTATEEVLAEMAESTPESSILKRVLDALRSFFSRVLGVDHVSDTDVRDILANARRYVETGNGGAGEISPAKTLFRTKTFPSKVFGQSPSKWDYLDNLWGLKARITMVDAYAGVERGIEEGKEAGKLDADEAFQANYYMRAQQQTTQWAGQFITNGPVKIMSEIVRGKKQTRFESEDGINLMQVSKMLESARKDAGWSSAEAEHAFQWMLTAARADAIPRGWERLHRTNKNAGTTTAEAKAEWAATKAKIDANPKAKAMLESAMQTYKAYNDGLIDFVVSSGAMSREEGSRLKRTPYVPFYRVDDGVVKLFTDSEHAVRIGNIKDQPDLKELLGDNKGVLPFYDGATQNTFMLTRMALRNKATMETANALFKAGFASKYGKGTASGDDVVHFKVNGENYFARIDRDMYGLPAHLIVKGMEGIKTTIPQWVRMMGAPANFLRQMVTRSPAYVLRQLMRDPIQAAILGGVDGVPVANAIKHIANMQLGKSDAERELMKLGAISSNIWTGDAQDQSFYLRQLTDGSGGWRWAMHKLDMLALQADAATRASVYEDSLAKGMSRAEAAFRAMEMQNFSRKGLSPGMQMLSTLIPFFNAQIQGLDVLYRSGRSAFGKKHGMPFAEQLDLAQKIKTRALMLGVTSMAYAMAMADDDDYRKAKPEERYQNFFIRVPGVDDFVKIPIPFEIGVLFKALPEAIIDYAMTDTSAKEAVTGMARVMNTSMLPNYKPAAIAPIMDWLYGSTRFGPIETPREQAMQPWARYRENTSEAAKQAGEAFNVSPLQIEHFVRGYAGSLGLAMLRAVDPVFETDEGTQRASGSAADNPLLGSMFQRKEGRYLVDRAYERANEIVSAQKTFKELVAQGKKAEAMRFAQENADRLVAADMAGTFKQEAGAMAAYERKLRNDPNKTTEQKDREIAQIRAAQNQRAQKFYQATERTTRQ